jgi:hypothetical protein
MFSLQYLSSSLFYFYCFYLYFFLPPFTFLSYLLFCFVFLSSFVNFVSFYSVCYFPLCAFISFLLPSRLSYFIVLFLSFFSVFLVSSFLSISSYFACFLLPSFTHHYMSVSTASLYLLFSTHLSTVFCTMPLTKPFGCQASISLRAST